MINFEITDLGVWVFTATGKDGKGRVSQEKPANMVWSCDASLGTGVQQDDGSFQVTPATAPASGVVSVKADNSLGVEVSDSVDISVGTGPMVAIAINEPTMLPPAVQAASPAAAS